MSPIDQPDDTAPEGRVIRREAASPLTFLMIVGSGLASFRFVPPAVTDHDGSRAAVLPFSPRRRDGVAADHEEPEDGGIRPQFLRPIGIDHAGDIQMGHHDDAGQKEPHPGEHDPFVGLRTTPRRIGALP